MGVVKLSKSEITDYQKYSSMLAGNEAYSPSSFDLLETQILTSTATSVTFTGLGSYTQYKHLQLRLTARDTVSSTGYAEAFIRFNSDTATNYSQHYTRFAGSLMVGSEINQTYIANLQIPGSTSTANRVGSAIIDILDFASTAHQKSVKTISGVYVGSQEIRFSGGNWRSTAAITSISLNAGGTGWAIGARFSLYGIKG